jgi:hypothetical protein
VLVAGRRDFHDLKVMTFELTDEETAALLKELDSIIAIRSFDVGAPVDGCG